MDKEHKDSIVWHTFGTKGEAFRRGCYNYEDPRVEYLNPDDETLRDMWLKAKPTSTVTMPSEEENKRFANRMRNARHDYFDPPMPRKRERYSRHALLVLPCARAMEIVRKFSGGTAAAAYLKQFSPHDSVALRALLKNGNYYLEEWNDAVCHLLVEMEDTELVDFFFEQGSDMSCNDIAAAARILVQGFGWKVIESPFLSCCGGMRDCDAMEALVHLAEALAGHNDQNRVLESLFNEAKYWDSSCVSDYFEFGQLWNSASHCPDITVFDKFVSLLKRSGPASYSWMIERLEQYPKDVGFSPRERDAFSGFVAARVKYLKLAVVNRGKPGVWNIPEASIPGEPEVEEFLRGPQQSKEFSGFPDTKAARVFMSKFVDDVSASMFSMECRADFRGDIGSKTVTLSKFAHKCTRGEEFEPFVDEELVELMEKYYPDEDRSWIRETWAKQAPERAQGLSRPKRQKLHNM